MSHCLSLLRFPERSALYELLTGSAFKTHPCDISAGLGKRFAGNRILVLVLARDRVATVPVGFTLEGKAQIGEARQHNLKQTGDLGRLLGSEAVSHAASAVLAIFTLGWQAQPGLNLAKEALSTGRDFEALRRPFLSPERYLRSVRNDRFYTAVEPSFKEGCLVFSLKKAEVESLASEVEQAGLALAGVKIGVACQLEVGLASCDLSQRPRNWLICDGMSSLFIDLESNDFQQKCAGTGKTPESLPRQSANRPNEVSQDILRFFKDGISGKVLYVGPGEIAKSVEQSHGIVGSLFEYPQEEDSRDLVLSALNDNSLHDLNPKASERRRPLGQYWRSWVVLGFFLVSVLGLGNALGLFLLYREQSEERLLREATRQLEAAACSNRNEWDLWQQKHRRARDLVSWLQSNLVAQGFFLSLFREFPRDVLLEKLTTTLDESGPQLSLEYALVGSEEALLRAERCLERSVLERGFQIGERHKPLTQGKAKVYRWKLLLPKHSSFPL